MFIIYFILGLGIGFSCGLSVMKNGKDALTEALRDRDIEIIKLKNRLEIEKQANLEAEQQLNKMLIEQGKVLSGNNL